MELTFAKCKAIADTLPIGLYTGRRIPVEVNETEETSFYSPMEDKIVVSYPIIKFRMEQVKDSCDDEEAIRSMLYHEVSHAVLTPTNLRCDDVTNIFEDERIESILRDYYHGVDFRKQVYDVHGGHAPKATNPMQAFFNAVRFGLGNGSIQKDINSLIKRFSSMNRNTPRWNDDRSGSADYTYAVKELYNRITKEFKSNPDQFNPPPIGNKGGKMKQMDSTGSGSDEEKKQSESNSESESNSDELKKSDSDKEAKSAIFKRSPVPTMDRDAITKMIGQTLNEKSGLDEGEVAKLNEFQKTVELIIGNFNKKNHGGSGITSYSGVFNPRNVARKDYRYFDRSMSTQGNNKFGTCHLNLIIDCSGSFSSNVPLTNGILAVLSEVERKNRNFSMDVAFINHDWRVCQNIRERNMVATGGNDVPEDMKERLLALQKPQTCNYNIVLFDGDAICEWDHGTKENRRRFSAFDMKQTTLITDPDNEQYMKPAFTSTKVVVTRNYTGELIKHITNALMVAFG